MIFKNFTIFKISSKGGKSGKSPARALTNRQKEQMAKEAQGNLRKNKAYMQLRREMDQKARQQKKVK